MNERATKHVYLFSGLGADERVFKFLDLSGFSVTCIKWIDHREEETMTQYAKRIARQLTNVNPILIGVSFGGMMAIEVAKFIETDKIIIISSVKTHSELPHYFKAKRKPVILRVIPDWLLTYPNIVSQWLFGTESLRDKKLLKEILIDTDANFLRWALNAIAMWRNEHAPPNVTHIHGRADRILPHRFVRCNFTVDDGGHFMIVNRAAMISKLVRDAIVPAEEDEGSARQAERQKQNS